MKPLDLNVSIQNTYEAARSEAVRLDRPVVLSRLALEDAQHDQILRDKSVAAPEPTVLQEDEYEDAKDHFAEGKGSNKNPKTPHDKKEPEKTDAPPEATKEAEDGFSTYA